MRSSTKNKIHFALWVVIVALAFLIQIGRIDDLLAFAVIGLLVLVQVGLWWQFRLRYLDYVLVPLRPDQLPRDTYQHFDRWTPQFMALGCGLVGDFQLSYFPWPTLVRYFLPPDNRIKGDVSQVDDIEASSFTTIFDDGREIETARFDADGSPNDRPATIVAPPRPSASLSDPCTAMFLASGAALLAESMSPPESAEPEKSLLPCREDRKL